MKRKKSEQRSFGNRLAGVTMPVRRKRIKWGRNWPCLCGSNKKYKFCCMSEIDNLTLLDDNASVDKVPDNIQSMITTFQEEQKRKEEEAKRDQLKAVKGEEPGGEESDG